MNQHNLAGQWSDSTCTYTCGLPGADTCIPWKPSLLPAGQTVTSCNGPFYNSDYSLLQPGYCPNGQSRHRRYCFCTAGFPLANPWQQGLPCRCNPAANSSGGKLSLQPVDATSPFTYTGNFIAEGAAATNTESLIYQLSNDPFFGPSSNPIDAWISKSQLRATGGAADGQIQNFCLPDNVEPNACPQPQPPTVRPGKWMLGPICTVRGQTQYGTGFCACGYQV